MLITQMNSSITNSIKNISEYSCRARVQVSGVYENVSTDIRTLWTLINKRKRCQVIPAI